MDKPNAIDRMEPLVLQGDIRLRYRDPTADNGKQAVPVEAS